MNWNGIELPDKNIYFKDEDVIIYCADCREVLPLIPDKSIDLVLTDPPYGIGIDYGGYDDTQDNLLQKIIPLMPLVVAKSKRVLITVGVKNIYSYPKPDWVLAWVSTAGVGRGAWGFCCWQPILAYGNDPYLENGKGSLPDIFMSNEITGNKNHPVSKPVNLWQKVLHRGSVNPTDLILDPFLGSGTTAYCAKKLGRKCIGIEIKEKYCEIAKKRLSQSVMRLELQELPGSRE